MPKHFENKDPLTHVREKRIEGMSSISEVHGTEMPGYLSAALDACRETSLVLLLFWLFLYLLHIPSKEGFAILLSAGLGWSAWKSGRSGWLGWAKLERLHRVIEQEKYEIEHHRPQEREELIALYREKGFEGKQLQDLVDVLMADQDRLLKVMLEEEMGLTLQAYEHPLQQSMGALIGSLTACVITFAFDFIQPRLGVLIAAVILLITASLSSALYEKNRLIPAVVWNLSIATLAIGIVYFLFKVII